MTAVPLRRTVAAVRLARAVLKELAAAAGLIATLVVLMSLLAGAGLDPSARTSWWSRAGEFISTFSQDRYGEPILPQFLAVCRQTVPLLAMSALWLVLLSVIAGTLLATRPRLHALRWLILAASALPSFTWPLVVFLIWPSRPFAGLRDVASWSWPALCLAVGDLNWLTGTTLVAEAVRHDLSKPHWRLAALLRVPSLSLLGPRLAVTGLRLLQSRWPHLLGGTVVLEVLFRIRGLGLWTWSAFIDSPPEPKVLLWVGLVGIVLARALRIVVLLAESFWLPEERNEVMEGDGTGEALTQSPGGTPAEGLAASSPSAPDAADWRLDVPLQMLPDEREVQPPAAWGSVMARVRYFVRVDPANRAKMALAIVVALAWIGLMSLIAATGSRLPESGPVFQEPTAASPFGTDGVGDHVAVLLWKGWRQQIPAWGACVLMIWLAAPLAVADFLAGWTLSRVARLFLQSLTAAAEWLGALVESTPKLVWLLACFTVMSHERVELKLALAMGVLFLPQVYAALKEELRPVRESAFLETKRMAGVSGTRVLWDNLAVSHALPVLCVQTALVLGNVVLTEAWLGYLGVRNRGQIFTWGSVLGTGIDEFVQIRPGRAAGQPFNDGVVFGPLLCVWLTICLMTVAGNGLKVLMGSYVWRLR